MLPPGDPRRKRAVWQQINPGVPYPRTDSKHQSIRKEEENIHDRNSRTNRSGHHVQAANEQLTDLQAAITSLDQRISEAQVELAAIADARQDRAHRLSTARAEAERLSGEHDQACLCQARSQDANQSRPSRLRAMPRKHCKRSG